MLSMEEDFRTRQELEILNGESMRLFMM